MFLHLILRLQRNRRFFFNLTNIVSGWLVMLRVAPVHGIRSSAHTPHSLTRGCVSQLARQARLLSKKKKIVDEKGKGKKDAMVKNLVCRFFFLLALARAGSTSPPPPVGVDTDRPRIEVIAIVTLSGSVADWDSASKRSALVHACSAAFGAQCSVESVTAGSVSVELKIVQYTDTGAGTSIVTRLADPVRHAAFNSEVFAATGLTVERSRLAAVVTTDVASTGLDGARLSDGAIAGIVCACFVVTCLLVYCSYTYRKRRQKQAADQARAEPSDLPSDDVGDRDVIAEMTSARAV